MTFCRKSHLAGLLALAASMLPISCAVGPNFKKPAAPNPSSYTVNPLRTTASAPGAVGGGPQHFVVGLDIPGQWWALFHSRALNSLIERSLKSNPDIKSAQEALTVAKENVYAQVGAFYPSISGDFSASRNKSSSALSPVTSTTTLYYNLFTPQVSVSYVPDVFGLNMRTVESLRAQAEQQRFALEATYLTLSSNVVSAAIQEASLRAQIAVTEQLIGINRKMLDVLRDQLKTGYTNAQSVLAQESQLAQVVATLPPLQKQLQQGRDLLARLAGALPNEDLIQKFDLSSTDLPRKLPVSLPSRLVEQRPDVRQAEENLHSASAQIGVAVANRLPSFLLSGNLGRTAVEIGQLFTPGTSFWSLSAGITQPIFQGGTLLHRERAARAAFRQADAQYRSTVLTAFQNVADTLHALDQDAKALKAALEADRAAKVSLDMTNEQVKVGYANFLTLLSAEQIYQQAEISLVLAEANRYSDTAALFQALGGGWWNRSDVVSAATGAKGRRPSARPASE
jgi:NodT family efflux transporter outer membrane factor (OMF) lipoprotein